MQWSDTEQAGFTTGKPWLKVGGKLEEINVEKELSSEDSILSYYKKLIRLRKHIQSLHKEIIMLMKQIIRKFMAFFANLKDSSCLY